MQGHKYCTLTRRDSPWRPKGVDAGRVSRLARTSQMTKRRQLSQARQSARSGSDRKVRQRAHLGTSLGTAVLSPDGPATEPTPPRLWGDAPRYTGSPHAMKPRRECVSNRAPLSGPGEVTSPHTHTPLLLCILLLAAPRGCVPQCAHLCPSRCSGRPCCWPESSKGGSVYTTETAESGLSPSWRHLLRAQGPEARAALWPAGSSRDARRHSRV